MILVSFFSKDNVLADEIKICYNFQYQNNENWAFRFLGDTRYTNRGPIMKLHGAWYAYSVL